MNLTSLRLYAQMQEEISQLEAYCKNEVLKIEGCFNIALSYWTKINDRLESYVFKHESDEIDFFKNIKPLFIASMEYYTLYYQAILFRPSADKDQLVLYWMHQLKRIESFFNRHKEFYHYYLSGCTKKDHFYFSRREEAACLPAGSRSSASPDHIAARILGYQKYHAYIETELSTLFHREFSIGQEQDFYQQAFTQCLN